MAYYNRPRKKVIRKRNVTIVIIPKKGKRMSKSPRKSRYHRGWYKW